MKEIKFAKVNPNAIIPTKRVEDGCYDVYACSDTDIVIKPHTNKLIPTGLITAFPDNYRISVRERGSNTKTNLIVMAGQIDSGYRGEIFVALYNGNDVPVEITSHIDEVEVTPDFIRVPMCKAISQLAIEYVPLAVVKEVMADEILNVKSERGTGCLGSSNK